MLMIYNQELSGKSNAFIASFPVFMIYGSKDLAARLLRFSSL